MIQRARPNISELIATGAADQAISRGIREALLRHKRLGESVVGWKDGRVVIIPPEEIPVMEEDLEKPAP